MVCLLVCSVFSVIQSLSLADEAGETSPASSTIPEFPVSPPENCKSALVMEASSGDVVFEMNSHTRLAPASMIKMMVVLIAMEQIASGELSYDDLITVSAAASRIGGSQVYLKQGEKFQVRDLLKTILIQSANDSCYSIAERIAGSDDGFVDMMNARAAQLGMQDTRFASTHGLPPGKGQEPDLSSAYDMAILAREIVTKHPEVLQWSSLDTEPFRDGQFIMTNTNRLVRQLEGCDGLKTGYYREAGFCVTATARQNGVRIIAVVMGCEKGKDRFSEAARLIKWGFTLFKNIDLVVPGLAVDKSIPVKNGEKVETVPVVKDGLQAVVRKNRVDDIIMKTTLERELTAPVESGTICGTVRFFLDERELGASPLITSEAIEALNWWGKFKRAIGFH